MIAVQQSQNINTPSIATSTTALAANNRRVYWQIQNVGTNPLFVLMGSGASSTVYHMVLKGGSADSDGLGASYSSQEVCYTGIVTIAGTSPKYVITEIAP